MNIKKIVVSSAAIVALGMAPIAFAQTTTDPTIVPTSVTTPGTPNTGAGGDAVANWFILGATGIAALAGIGYLTRKPRATVNTK